MAVEGEVGLEDAEASEVDVAEAAVEAFRVINKATEIRFTKPRSEHLFATTRANMRPLQSLFVILATLLSKTCSVQSLIYANDIRPETAIDDYELLDSATINLS